MAEGRIFTCSHCEVQIEAWDDGKPYYVTETGKKKYVYHPDPKLKDCIGNDSPTMCLNCGKRFKIDSRNPISKCPKCSSSDISDEFSLDAKTCPFCKIGTFVHDVNCRMIS
jgi:DNA-directed RNA polymerase subunit RPC12/RpoP